MTRKLILAGSLVCLAAQADFSYEQTSRITGGAMQSMMRVAGVFSKTAREPIKSTVMVKGDRMATITGGERIDVIDLSAETFTEIDLKRKTYSVVTFAEMAQALEKAAAEMRKKENQGAEMNMKADVKHTGASRSVNGLEAKQSIVTITTEVTDTKNGNKGEFNMVMDMWLAPDVAGYDEVRNFYLKMANKVNWNPLGGMAGAMMAGHSKGINELIKEMSKLQGVPVLQTMRVGAMGGPGQPTAESGSAAAQQEQQAPAPSAGEAAGQAAAGAAAGRAGRLGGLAGGLGGFGGFGRRKKQQEQQEQPSQQPPQQAQAGASQPAQGSLIEMTTELAGFSSSAVDASKFDVPAGFKKVDSQRYKD